jgi:hypothetical protein
VLVGSLGEDLAGFAISARNEVLVNVSTDKDGNPALSLGDKGQKAILGVRGDGKPTPLMMGSAGTLAATTAELSLKDPSRKTLFSTAPEADGQQRSR